MTPAFTVSQSATTPASFTVTDTSTSVTGTITQRRIYVQDEQGNYLTGDSSVDWTLWPLADSSITLAFLTGNTAVNIRVDWLNVSNVVVETLNANYGLSQFGKQFLFYLVQLQGLTPGIYQDSNYSGNLALFWTNIVGGDNAITYGNSLAAAQNCYNRANYMEQNESDFF